MAYSSFNLINIYYIMRCCFFFAIFSPYLPFIAKKYKHIQNVSGRFYRYILLQMRRRIKAVVLRSQGQDINPNGVFPIFKTEVLHKTLCILYCWYLLYVYYNGWFLRV